MGFEVVVQKIKKHQPPSKKNHNFVANDKKFVTEVETSITITTLQITEKKQITNKIFALTAGVELYHRMIFRSDDALLRPLFVKKKTKKKPANLQNIRNLHRVKKQLIS